MRSIGFVAVVLGGLIAFLGFQGKIGPAWAALKTGGGASK